MPFPLLFLPINLQILVLQTVDKTIDLISLSLCSKSAKAVVKSLDHLKLEVCELRINDGFHFNLYFGQYGLHFKLTQVLATGPLSLVRVEKIWEAYDGWNDKEFPKSWRIPGITCRDWIDHLCEVCLSPEINYIDFGGPFERGSLRNVLKGIDVKLNYICNVLSDDHLKNALAVVPNSEELVLGQYEVENIQFHDKQFMRKSSMRNYRLFRLYRICLDHFKSLDNFLLINAKTIALFKTMFRKSDINRFLKLWIRGAMRTFEFLFLEFAEWIILNWEGLLNGVECVKIAGEQERTKTFKNGDAYGTTTVCNTDGIAIRRRTDGIIATLSYKSGRLARFDFFVWN